MRPQILNPLFASVKTLSGIGPKLEKLYARLIARDGETPHIIDAIGRRIKWYEQHFPKPGAEGVTNTQP